MLETMQDFFANRIAHYDEHMLMSIESAWKFYAYTASFLPTAPESRVLDLGCGTELELEPYFATNPSARVTGIDLSAVMLERLASKCAGKHLRLLCGSYFTVPFGEAQYDAAVSVESLHHFSQSKSCRCTTLSNQAAILF